MGILDPLKKLGDTVGSWTAKIPDSTWATFMGGFLILAVGIISLIAGKPWLFLSLGPTAYLQVENPGLPSARFYNTIVGHYVGLISWLIAIAIFSLWTTQSVLISHQLTPAWVGAVAIAIALTIIINMALHSSHPPAAATALLVSLGSFRTQNEIISIIVCVLILAILGEILRRIRTGGNESAK